MKLTNPLWQPGPALVEGKGITPIFLSPYHNWQKKGRFKGVCGEADNTRLLKITYYYISVFNLQQSWSPQKTVCMTVPTCCSFLILNCHQNSECANGPTEFFYSCPRRRHACLIHYARTSRKYTSAFSSPPKHKLPSNSETVTYFSCALINKSSPSTNSQTVTQFSCALINKSSPKPTQKL